MRVVFVYILCLLAFVSHDRCEYTRYNCIRSSAVMFHD
jgi:hypothetical protein